MGMAFRRLVLLLLLGWMFMAGSDGKLSCKSPQFLEFGKQATIHCSPMDEFFGVFWYNSRDYKTELPVLFYQEGEIKGIGYEKGEFDVYPNGSLIIKEVSVQHDRYFTVAYLRSREDTVTKYHEIKCVVIVHPVPFYPVVEGCNGRQHCTLLAEMEGNLTCSLNGVRPKVQLIWTAVHRETSPVVSWLSLTTTVDENDISYNISLTSLFKISSTQYSGTATMECRTNGTYTEIFDMVSRVDLIFNVEDTTGENNPTQTGVQIPKLNSKLAKIVGIVLPVILISVIFGVYIILKGYRKKRKQTPPDNKEETERMLMEKLVSIKAKKEELVKQLKEAYQERYSKIQPNPINDQRFYSVEELYVEGGIEIETLIDENNDSRLLGSYPNVFESETAQPQRLIVQSGPGFGKTFLTMKFAYDWCNKISSSPVRNIEILIVLQLSKVNGIASVYQGILQTVLSHSTSLCEADIKDVLSLTTGSSVLIVLDGFNEYINKYEGENFDINKIIGGKMLQESNVILTTRAPYFPREIAPATKRVRLTGFDERIRQLYVKKVLDSSTAKIIEDFDVVVEEFDEVRELCITPMFWVMFVHMHHLEGNENLLSVTRVLKYIMLFLQHKVFLTLREEGGECIENKNIFETGHQIINEHSYNNVISCNMNINFQKSSIEQLGKNIYKQFICSGILVEDSNNVEGSETRIKFRWPLFAYWYAAKFLVKMVCKNKLSEVKTPEVNENGLYKFAVMYRLACGLEGDASSVVLEHTIRLTTSDQFLTMCSLEKSSCLSEVEEAIRSVCKQGLIISGHDSLLQQKSTLQIIKIAKSHKIDITKLVLHDCIQEITKDGHEIMISESRWKVSSKFPLVSLVVFSRERDLTDEQTKNVIQFAGNCVKLAILEFTAGVPPMKFGPGFLHSIKSKKASFKVRWRARSTSSPYVLDMESGKWKMEKDGAELTADDVGKALLTNKCDREALTEENIKQELHSYRETLRNIADGKSTANRSDTIKTKRMPLLEKDKGELAKDGIGKIPPSYSESSRKNTEGESTTKRRDTKPKQIAYV